ncbi:MAG TPA: hypothetical protein VKH17_04590, partial [Acidimicrobiia bacterium]|nr:hypothetical protein [Acidimicrobiia bacterium]
RRGSAGKLVALTRVSDDSSRTLIRVVVALKDADAQVRAIVADRDSKKSDDEPICLLTALAAERALHAR